MNYCFDKCEHNSIERRFWEDKDERGRAVQHSKAVSGTNRAIKCALGYKVVVSNPGALLMAIGNNSVVCPRQKKVYEVGHGIGR